MNKFHIQIAGSVRCTSAKANVAVNLRLIIECHASADWKLRNFRAARRRYYKQGILFAVCEMTLLSRVRDLDGIRDETVYQRQRSRIIAMKINTAHRRARDLRRKKLWQ